MTFTYCEDMPPLSLFKFLRVLHIEHYGVNRVDLTGLPNMHQLRYLAVHDGWDVELPTQITGLRHLETFDVYENVRHPFDIVHLPCLMFLNVSWYAARTPYGIGNMKSLRYVEDFNLMDNSIDNIESLGELASLRVISVYGYRPYAASMNRRMDALCSSLGKVGISLEYLGLYIEGCVDALMDLSPPPRRLERLWMGDRIKDYIDGELDPPDWPAELGSSFFSGHGWNADADECCFFSRVPNWMGELSNLKELEINVIKPDVGILAELPALTLLRIYIIQGLREFFVIHAREFPVLKHLELRLSSPSYLAFQAGAMPKLQWLRLQFSSVGCHQNARGPAGMQHLSALEDFFAISNSDYRATEYEKTCAESALKGAIKLHPKHPRLHINSSYDHYFK
ncbi:disease resistance protein RGA5-like isoform X2 [Triticum aestivum]|nr:disease resistance protein RGA5-like isoform X2 [Triticum aestivum]